MKLAKENLGKVSVTIEKAYHSVNKEYDKLVVVEEEGQFRTFISRKPVPIGIELTDREFWLPFSSVKESIVIDYNKFKQYIRTGEGLLDDSIVTRHIKDRNVTGDKIAEATITFINIANEAVTLPKINKEAIDTTLTKEGHLAEAKHTGDRLLNVEGLSVVKVPSTKSTVLDAWQIIDKKGNVHGVTINTYKDKSIDAIWLSVHEEDPKPENPEVKVDNPRYLNIIYNKADGTQQKVSIPLASFVTEAEFSKNGFKVINGVVNLKISSDITTSRYFHFDADGNITLDGFEERILEDLGTLEHSQSGDGTMWGEFKEQEEIREQVSNSAHQVFSDNWDEQDDDPEDYDPLAVTEASYAYNWKSVTNPNKTGNIEDLVNKVDVLAVGIFYGYHPNENELPQDITEKGYAYVGTDNPYKIYNFDGTQWKDSGTTIQATSEADEEDITYNENDKLTFKDRNNTDGIGYVILRKNKSFAEQVTKANTIYEIRYEFNLNDTEVTIPEGCILKFEGGILKSGILIGTNTCIESSITKIIDSTLIISGTWNIINAYPEWFGAKGDGITDDTLAINLCLKYFDTTYISNNTYLVNTLDDKGRILDLPNGHSIIGCNKKDRNISTNSISNIKTTNPDYKAILYIHGANHIERISIEGKSYPTEDYEHYGILSELTETNYKSISRLNLEMVQVISCGTAYNLCCYLSTIKQCYAYYCGIGFFIHGGIDKNTGNLTVEETSITMQTCYAVNSRSYGYYLRGITYSNFMSLAADGCGMSYDGIEKFSDTEYSYNIEQVKNTVFNSLGAEVTWKFLRIHACHNCIFNTPIATLGYVKTGTNHANIPPSQIIVVKYCVSVKMYGPRLLILPIINKDINPSTGVISWTDVCDAIHLEGSASSAVSLYLDGVYNTREYENLACIQNITYNGYLDSTNVVSTSVETAKDTYTLTGPYIIPFCAESILFKSNPNNAINLQTPTSGTKYFGYQSNRILDLHGKTLIINPDGDGNIIMARNGNYTWGFKNGTIIFNKVQFSLKDMQNGSPGVLNFDNCKAIFKDCIISTPNITLKEGDYLFNTTNNSSCVFENSYIRSYDIKVVDYSITNCIFEVFPYYNDGINGGIRCIKGEKILYKNIQYTAQSDGKALLLNDDLVVDTLPNFPSGYEEYFKGCHFFHENKIKYWTGIKWIDATGADV